MPETKDVSFPADDPNLLAHEAEIIWLDPDSKDRPYLRENLVWTRTRTKALTKFPDERVIAYTTLAPQAQRIHGDGALFLRRVFTLRDYDSGEPKDPGTRTTAPNGAVDTQTLRPGCRGDFVRLQPLSFDGK